MSFELTVECQIPWNRKIVEGDPSKNDDSYDNKIYNLKMGMAN